VYHCFHLVPHLSLQNSCTCIIQLIYQLTVTTLLRLVSTKNGPVDQSGSVYIRSIFLRTMNNQVMHFWRCSWLPQTAHQLVTKQKWINWLFHATRSSCRHSLANNAKQSYCNKQICCFPTRTEMTRPSWPKLWHYGLQIQDTQLWLTLQFTGHN